MIVAFAILVGFALFMAFVDGNLRKLREQQRADEVDAGRASGDALTAGVDDYQGAA